MTAAVAALAVVIGLAAVAHAGYLAGRHDAVEDVLRNPGKYGLRRDKAADAGRRD